MQRLGFIPVHAMDNAQHCSLPWIRGLSTWVTPTSMMSIGSAKLTKAESSLGALMEVDAQVLAGAGGIQDVFQLLAVHFGRSVAQHHRGAHVLAISNFPRLDGLWAWGADWTCARVIVAVPRAQDTTPQIWNLAQARLVICRGRFGQRPVEVLYNWIECGGQGARKGALERAVNANVMLGRREKA